VFQAAQIMRLFLRNGIIFLVRVYQQTVGLVIGPCCRFYPSCSEYAVEALEKHGLVRGVILALARVFKCGPWHPGGVDRP
jgi:uncharacterized protein